MFDIKEKQSAKFLKIAIDKNLDMRAEIEEMVEQESFARLVTSISMVRKQSERNITDTIIYFKNKKNSGAGQCHESTT